MIKRIFAESSIDYPGHFGPIVFTGGCNFNCGFCHNASLGKAGEIDISNEQLIKFLKTKIGWYTGICISGGEPTLHAGLYDLLKKLKELKLDIKLDSNGTNPAILKKFVDEKLVDYIAMDIKAPDYLYSAVAGVAVNIERIEESIKFISSLPEMNFEFRTTIPFVFEEGKVRFMNEQETEDMAKWVKKLVGDKNIKWVLQGFVSRGKKDMNDERLCVENLPIEFQKTSPEYLTKLAEILKKYFSRVEIR